MSRSTTMLMALAPPAARAPPSQGGRHQPDGRQPALGHHHGGQRGDQQQLDDPRLGQGDIRPRPSATTTALVDPGGWAPEWTCGLSLGPGLARDQATRPRYAGPSVAAPAPPTVSPSLSHRLERPGPGPDRAHRRHRRGRPPDRVGPGLQRLARLLRRPPDPSVQFHSLVEFGNRMVTVVMVIVVAAAFLGAVFRVPRRRDLIWLERRPGGRGAGPGRHRRHRRVHQAQPLRRHGALRRHHRPPGRRRGPGPPLDT